MCSVWDGVVLRIGCFVASIKGYMGHVGLLSANHALTRLLALPLCAASVDSSSSNSKTTVQTNRYAIRFQIWIVLVHRVACWPVYPRGERRASRGPAA